MITRIEHPSLTRTYGQHMVCILSKDSNMARRESRAAGKKAKRGLASKSTHTVSSKRASIFRNGSNQAVRLPQELKFPENVKEVRIRKQGDGLLLTPVRPNWSSFFEMDVSVPDDFLNDREDGPPQSRDPL